MVCRVRRARERDVREHDDARDAHVKLLYM